MLTIFQLFAVRSEASILRMLEGSPQEFLHKPIVKYLTDRGAKINVNRRVLELLYDKDPATGKPSKINGMVVAPESGDAEKEVKKYDVVVAATDVPGIQKLLPQDFRQYKEFDGVYKLDAVPVLTVQLRFDGWVTG